MKFHFVTVGEPKLAYAQRGWDEYFARLARFHQVRVTRIADRRATDAALIAAAGNSYVMPLDLLGKELSSPQLAKHIEDISLHGTSEATFIIGGPEGFGDAVRQRANFLWKLSDLTLPHDLAMVVMLEALYRASSINAGHPYHK